MSDILYIVVPCYNEEAVLPETSKRLREKMKSLMAAGKVSEKSKVLFTYDPSVHDYSTDKPELTDIGHNHFVYGNKK